jgi:molecular chaperone DnaK (HSP70)
MKHHVIGIDLGTTYSAVAAFDKDEEQALMFQNPETGEETTPSVVALHLGTHKVIVGRAAKRNLAAEPLNTIIEIKREMGEVFDREKHAGRPGFDAGKPVRARFAQFPDQWYLPQEISSFILMRMKEIAEYHIGEEIRDAVVTVPAYFHATQKKATEQAALLAGLYPRQLIPEPTAAAICFGVDEYDPDQHHYMVYDLGGGTFDVSIIEVQADDIKVVATAGDPRLGGSDFDDAITAWALVELKNKYGLDLSQDPKAQAAIKYEAEQAKIRLSDFETTRLELAELKPDVAPVLELTRSQFQQLIEDHLSRSMGALELALELAGEAGCRREQVSAILLVGGSSNIPVVRAMLMDYFGQGEEFVRGDLDPASVVARGAAILAKRFMPTEQAYDVRSRPDATLVDQSVEEELKLELITEHSLGVGIQDNRVVRLIERGENLPTARTKPDFTNPGPVEFVRAPVYQGEGEYTYENTLIGEVVLGPMQPLPTGSHTFEVTFTLDKSGLLLVTVKHVEANKEYQAKFEHDTTVEGDDALEAMRGKLLNLYQPMSFATEQAAATAPETPGSYTPPPPTGAAAAEPTAEAAGAPAAEDAEQGAAAPEAEAAAGAAAEVLEPTVDVPDQFKQIVRRARKQLLKDADADLLQAFNGFVSALNEGRSEEDLIELSDDLADAFDDARDRAR